MFRLILLRLFYFICIFKIYNVGFFFYSFGKLLELVKSRLLEIVRWRDESFSCTRVRLNARRDDASAQICGKSAVVLKMCKRLRLLQFPWFYGLSFEVFCEDEMFIFAPMEGVSGVVLRNRRRSVRFLCNEQHFFFVFSLRDRTYKEACGVS